MYAVSNAKTSLCSGDFNADWRALEGGGSTLIGSLTALSLRKISGSFSTRTQLKLIKLKLNTCCSLLRSSLQENTLMNTFSFNNHVIFQQFILSQMLVVCDIKSTFFPGFQISLFKKACLTFLNVILNFNFDYSD